VIVFVVCIFLATGQRSAAIEGLVGAVVISFGMTTALFIL
jgi:hypothetical protein